MVKSLADASKIPIAFFTQDGKKSLFDGDEVNTGIIYDYIEKWQPESVIVINRLDDEIEQLLVDEVYADA